MNVRPFCNGVTINLYTGRKSAADAFFFKKASGKVVWYDTI